MQAEQHDRTLVQVADVSARLLADRDDLADALTVLDRVLELRWLHASKHGVATKHSQSPRGARPRSGRWMLRRRVLCVWEVVKRDLSFKMILVSPLNKLGHGRSGFGGARF